MYWMIDYRCFFMQFDSQVHDKRRGPDPQMPFEYCYVSRFFLKYYQISTMLTFIRIVTLISMYKLCSSNQTEIPIVSLKMKGESEFPVTNPIILFSTLVR